MRSALNTKYECYLSCLTPHFSFINIIVDPKEPAKKAAYAQVNVFANSEVKPVITREETYVCFLSFLWIPSAHLH